LQSVPVPVIHPSMDSGKRSGVTLRQMRITDLDDLLAFQAHPENLALQPVEPFTREDAERYLLEQAGLDSGVAAGWVSFAIALKEDDRMIGETGVYLSAADARQGDIGWSIHPDHKRRGYATAAGQALLAFLFSKRGLHRVTGACEAGNAASRRLMERLGMRLEGQPLQSREIHGEWRDECQYALLQSEWQRLS
jgi:RimJ/RimL family protein N-acetyltransferase